MSYRTKYVRRQVRKRRNDPTTGMMELELECGHRQLTSRWWVGRPVCWECNEAAADLGRAERFIVPHRTQKTTNGHNLKK